MWKKTKRVTVKNTRFVRVYNYYYAAVVCRFLIIGRFDNRRTQYARLTRRSLFLLIFFFPKPTHALRTVQRVMRSQGVRLVHCKLYCNTFLYTQVRIILCVLRLRNVMSGRRLQTSKTLHIQNIHNA